MFVFTDAWHQSVHFVKDPNDDEQRMTFAYRRASKAMLVTQITTFFAFLATAFSPIIPIKAFGIWAATIVATGKFETLKFAVCKRVFRSYGIFLQTCSLCMHA